MDSLTKARAQRLVSPLMDFAAVRARLLDACAPVAPARILAPDCGWAAEDITAPASVPPCDVALRDGYAVASADLVGASSFSPALLLSAPMRLNAGEALPDGCDAIVPVDSLGSGGPPWEATQGVSPGEGVRRTGEDAAAGAVLVRAGRRLDPLTCAALREACVAATSVRQPRVHVVGTAGAHSAAAFLHELVQEFGAAATLGNDVETSCVDLLLVAGGAGEDCGDAMAARMRDAGEVFAHGLALEPGRLAAIGRLGATPVVVCPGRFDGVLALWLSLVAPALLRLAGAGEADPCVARGLTRKVSSAVGMAQIVLLQLTPEGWAPLATGDITLTQSLQADGFLLIPAGSEGLAGGEMVRPMPLPGLRRV